MIFDISADHREGWDFDEKLWFPILYHIIAESKILMKNHDFRYFIRSSGRMRFWWKIMIFDILSYHRGKEDFDYNSWFSIFYQIIGKNEILMKNHDVRYFIISSRSIRFWWKIRIFDIVSDHREEWDFDGKSWCSTFWHIIVENKILMKNHVFRFFIRSSGRMRFWWKIMMFDILSYHRGKIRFWWKAEIFDILSDHREEWDFDEKSWCSISYHIIAEK